MNAAARTTHIDMAKNQLINNVVDRVTGRLNTYSALLPDNANSIGRNAATVVMVPESMGNISVFAPCTDAF